MSLASISAAYRDGNLRTRIETAVWKEIHYNTEKRDSWFGQEMLYGEPGQGLDAIYHAVANATEADYEAALKNEHGSPGSDSNVISDAEITSAVGAAWPTPKEPPA